MMGFETGAVLWTIGLMFTYSATRSYMRHLARSEGREFDWWTWLLFDLIAAIVCAVIWPIVLGNFVAEICADRKGRL